jgi:V8-like Glu-specific endopeptidase
VLYSIPSLPGSSGSPIFGESGELVAINYAGINNTQSFNYGILSKHLFTLFQKLNN